MQPVPVNSDLKSACRVFQRLRRTCILADVKGDLAAMCRQGEANGSVAERAAKMGLDKEGFSFQKYPVNFWDVYGEKACL